jgi:glycosyltransferase involved in cell wall biosynthesis
MWRNHHAGSEFTNIAVSLCTKIFCPSKYSYTAKFKKAIFMPVGIDTSFFVPPTGPRNPLSILFLGRIAPVKKPDLLIRALGDCARKGIQFQATIVGDPLPKDFEYRESLKKIAEEEGVSSSIIFHDGVSNEVAKSFYASHEISVNLSSSGMYDKTIFEAMSCETLVLASNENLREIVDDMFIFKEGDRKELAHKLEKLLRLSEEEKVKYGKVLRKVADENHSLKKLSSKLFAVLSSN